MNTQTKSERDTENLAMLKSLLAMHLSAEERKAIEQCIEHRTFMIQASNAKTEQPEPPQMPDENWVTGEDEALSINAMSDLHVRNCLKMIMCFGKEGATWSVDSSGKLVHNLITKVITHNGETFTHVAGPDSAGHIVVYSKEHDRYTTRFI